MTGTHDWTLTGRWRRRAKRALVSEPLVLQIEETRRTLSPYSRDADLVTEARWRDARSEDPASASFAIPASLAAVCSARAPVPNVSRA